MRRSISLDYYMLTSLPEGEGKYTVEFLKDYCNVRVLESRGWKKLK
jgi:hypothetical protein